MRAFVPFVIRDLVLAAITGALVVADAALRTADASGVVVGVAWGGMIVGVACGVMITVTGFLAHEWGHWLGSVASGGKVEAPRRLGSVFLFNFDTARSTRAQFLWMSAGGYAATAVALPVIALWADLHSASGITALTLTVLGVGVTLALEVPTTIRIARGAPLPTGGVYTGGERHG